MSNETVNHKQKSSRYSMTKRILLMKKKGLYSSIADMISHVHEQGPRSNRKHFSQRGRESGEEGLVQS